MGARKKPDLYIRWSKRERALVYGGGCKPTSGMLSGVFEMMTQEALYSGTLDGDDPRRGKTLAQELERRGYDLTTLRFSIRKVTP